MRIASFLTRRRSTTSGLARWATLACALAAPAAQAQVNVVLKDTAIVASLATWVAAGWHHDDWNCAAANRLRLQAGTDQELRSASAGWVFGQCEMHQPLMGWSLGADPTLMASAWWTRGPVSGQTRAADVALIPFFRWQRPAFGGWNWQAEVGIGAAALSTPDIGDRRKSSTFQFSDHLGFGLSQPRSGWSVQVAYRHISNADLWRPNNAVDFKGLSLTWTPH